MTSASNRSMTVPRLFEVPTDTAFSYFGVTILSRRGPDVPGDSLRGHLVNTFMQTLRTLRWDDHRFYHHSTINQSLHLVSAIVFCISYALLLVDPAIAAVLAWTVSMTTRQAGHFFFEPRGYDDVNQVSDEYKEEVKAGYNIQRKIAISTILRWML